MHVRPGQYSSVMQRDLKPFPLKLFEKAVKIKWQDKNPDTEVLKKAGMHSIHAVLKLAQLSWTGHLMSNFQRKSCMENYKMESALKVARRNATKTPYKPL